MDVFNSSSQTAAPAPAGQGHRPVTSQRKRVNGKLMRVLSVIVLVCVALIIALVALYLALGRPNDESKYIDKSKFQAVFLNGGQVYFGKVRSLNTRFITIDNIYYLRVNNQQANGATAETANQDVSLAKLGCELHGPTDTMVINREQVLFWENLKDDGQVVKAITEYVKANPQGQKCDSTTPTGEAAPSTTPTNTPSTTTPAKQ